MFDGDIESIYHRFVKSMLNICDSMLENIHRDGKVVKCKLSVIIVYILE